MEGLFPSHDQSAYINFKKNTGKLACAFAYYIAKGRSKGWKYFFPSDSHIAGMQAFHFYKLQAERLNYKMN